MDEFYCPTCNGPARLYGERRPNGRIGFHCRKCGPHVLNNDNKWEKKTIVTINTDIVLQLKAIHNVDVAEDLKDIEEDEFSKMIRGEYDASP